MIRFPVCKLGGDSELALGHGSNVRLYVGAYAVLAVFFHLLCFLSVGQDLVPDSPPTVDVFLSSDFGLISKA
jgi:hypothetical protein